MSNRSIDKDIIRAHLIDRMESLVEYLLGKPSSRKGAQWRFGSKGALAIEMAGTKRGEWFDHSADAGGDPFDLIQHTHGFDGFPKALAWAVEWLGEAPAAPPPPRKEDRHDATIERAEKVAYAQKMAAGMRPITETLAARYLSGRGITDLSANGIGFHSSHQSSETAKGFPSLMLVATNQVGEVRAIQAVRINSTTAWKIDTAAKITNGVMDGAAVRLRDSASRIVVTEGPEDGLSIFQAVQDVGVWAALGVSNFGKLPYPAGALVIIAAQNDPDGSDAAKLLPRAVLEIKRRGFEVTIIRPPEGIKDWNLLHTDNGEDAVRQAIGAALAANDDVADAEPEEGAIEGGLFDEVLQASSLYPLPKMDSMKLAYMKSASGKVKIFKRTGKDKETQEELWSAISTPFGVPARLRQVDKADSYGLRVLVEDMSGRPRALDFSRAALASNGGAEIKAKLFEAGLRTEQDGDCVAVAMLKAADPDCEIVVVNRPGWHHIDGPDAPIFVTPSGDVIGSPDGSELELSVNSRLKPRLSMGGTLDGWKGAAEKALGVDNCPHWVIGAVAAFAGPVLALAGLDSCGINISGMSSGGKSTAQRLAVSAWSNPKLGSGGLFRSMRVTENAVEALCQGASGTVLALDELAHADGKAIGRMIYSIAGGVGKSRMNGDAALRDSYSWSTFALVSSEHSLEDTVKRAGGQWLAGMAVRVADIDVTHVNRTVDRATLTEITRIDQNFGHAGPAFVQAMIEDGLHQSPEDLRRLIDKAAIRLAGQDADSARVRAATSFGLLLVVGQLAKQYGILPETAPVKEAVTWAWEQFGSSSDALALKPDDQAIANLRLWIAERWGTSIRSVDADSGTREAVAWFDNDTVYLPTSRIVEACGGAIKEQHVAKVLNERGLLSKRGSPERLAIKYVPKIGHVQSYAMRKSEFGRTDVAQEPVLTAHSGGVR
jgi:phage/plasmid primase-like uncharacterized protein